MKKILNTAGIANELEGASLFFTKPPTPQPSPEAEKSIVENVSGTPLPAESNIPKEDEEVKKSKIKKQKGSMASRHHDTMQPRYRDTMTPQIHDVSVEIIRKAVKEFGKEAATHRFTEAEKKQIADLIYTYMNRGFKTTENEITRIAVNFIFEDYKENGENSVLHKILKALKE